MNLHNTLHGWLELANTSSLEEKVWEKRYFTKLNYDIEIYEEIQSSRVDCIAVSSIVSIEPDASSLKCFLIITHQKIYELRADSEATAKNWVFALRDWKNFIEKYQGLFITDNEKEILSQEEKKREQRKDEIQKKNIEKHEFRKQREEERRLRELNKPVEIETTRPVSTNNQENSSEVTMNLTRPSSLARIEPQQPIVKKKSIMTHEQRLEMKKVKAMARKSEVMNLRNRITQVRKGIDVATKNESDSRQKLLSLSQSNTDSVGFVEFIELLNVLDKRKSQRSEIKSKISRCYELSKGVKAKKKVCEDKAVFHHQNLTKVSENLAKLQLQQSELSIILKEKKDRIASLKLLLDDHRSSRILFRKDVKEINEELKDQIQREDSAYSSVLLQNEILVFEKKRIMKLSESEFQNNQYDMLLKQWVRERQRVLLCRKEYIKPQNELIPISKTLEDLHYNYFKSLALGIKLNALITDDKTLSTHLLVDELYADIKRLNFHWKFWPQILGEYMKMTFNEEEAKKKYVFNPENLKDNDNQNDDNSLKISKNKNIFQDKNDDLISLTLPSCFSERKFTLKHYNKSDSNSSSNGYSKPSWLKDNSLDFSDLHQHYNKKGQS